MLAALAGNLVKVTAELISLVLVIWFLIRWLRDTKEDVSAVLLRWGLTAFILLMMFLTAITARDPFSQIAAILFGAVCGLVLAILWVPTMCDFVGRFFASLYDGGSQEIEPQPLYSLAEAKRKRGQYREAVAEFRKQLTMFPDDLTGHLLLAETLAENLNDLPGAHAVIEQWLARPGASAGNFGVALNRLADWYLKVGLDIDTARLCLERISNTFPGSEAALLAAQRIAHLGDIDMLTGKRERQAITMRQGVESLGLRDDTASLRPAEEDPAAIAGKYVTHLNEHPGDGETREKLAVIYAEHYQRIDMAADQLEQMITTPNQPMKQVVHWLNLLADFHIKLGADLPGAQMALQRIIELYPRSAPAENATKRLAHLKLELRGKQTSQAVKLGSYEKNIGLNRTLPD
ncbi:MAG TPA: hypothetical protein VHH73_13170 [Verrucomicrobiae bacterium]|nr:hypothetical protein [Verrucomicrobiae bacterium]